MNINYLVIIPARSGSKGVKNKNIMNVHNNRLLYYVGKLAEDCDKIDSIFLSTDSKEYSDIFKGYNFKKNISDNYLRKKNISDDNSICNEYILDALYFLNNKNVTVQNIMILQPTNILTSLHDLYRCINNYENLKTKIIVSVSKPLQNVGCMIDINETTFKYYIDFKGSNRQDYKINPYVINGNIYITSYEEFNINKNGNIFMIEGKTNFFYENINKGFQIDYYNDIYLIENIMKTKFLNYGWIVEKNILSIYEIDFLKKEINNYLNSISLYDVNENKSNINIFLEFFNNHTKLKKVIYNLFNEDVEILNIINNNDYDFKQHMYQDNILIHNDGINYFSAYIAMNYIDENNGGLKIWNHSNNVGELKHNSLESFKNIDESEYDKFDINDFLINRLEPGDIQFIHCMTIRGYNKKLLNIPNNSIIVQYKTINNNKNI